MVNKGIQSFQDVGRYCAKALKQISDDNSEFMVCFLKKLLTNHLSKNKTGNYQKLLSQLITSIL